MKEQKIKRNYKFKISTGTIVAIIIILAIFAVWNFFVLPRILEAGKVHQPAEIPTVKRGDISFINNEIKIREMTVPTLIAPQNALGKANPFE